METVLGESRLAQKQASRVANARWDYNRLLICWERSRRISPSLCCRMVGLCHTNASQTTS